VATGHTPLSTDATQECPIEDLNEQKFLIDLPGLLKTPFKGWYMLFGAANQPDFSTLLKGKPKVTPADLAFHITEEALKTQRTKTFYAWQEARDLAKEASNPEPEP